jgi:hypothetical protein
MSDDSKSAPLSDHALYMELKNVDFDGPAWDYFAECLARYAIPIMMAWVKSGLIFQKCGEKRLGVSCGEWYICDDDVDDIVIQTVTTALDSFRARVLRGDRRKPGGQAKITTWFINSCIYEFPNVWRTWVGQQKKNKKIAQVMGCEPPVFGDGPNPESREEAFAGFLKEEFEDRLISAIILLRDWGYTHAPPGRSHSPRHMQRT